jgi:diacylglycerol kinase (ATP)
MNDKEIDSLKQNKTTPGVARWYAALTNSINGLKFGLKNEAAMREEIILLLAAIPLSIYLVESIWLRLAMVLSILFVLIVEVLNSALEATLDRVSEEYHQLTKAAKDLGSLAVLLAMMLAISIWVVAIFSE